MHINIISNYKFAAVLISNPLRCFATTGPSSSRCRITVLRCNSSTSAGFASTLRSAEDVLSSETVFSDKCFHFCDCFADFSFASSFNLSFKSFFLCNELSNSSHL